LRESQYLIAMDFSNKRNIESLMEKYRIKHEQLFLIREFHPNVDDLEVPDPYYGGEDGFEKVYRILDNSIEHFLDHLKQAENI
jgi:protein-tyrosine phosphatase